MNPCFHDCSRLRPPLSYLFPSPLVSPLLLTTQAAAGRAPSQKTGGPVVVHCSAGVGRSGSIVAMASCTAALDATGRVDALAVVAAMRSDRVMLVQHPVQFELVWAACRLHAQRRGRSFEVVASS